MYLSAQPRQKLRTRDSSMNVPHLCGLGTVVVNAEASVEPLLHRTADMGTREALWVIYPVKCLAAPRPGLLYNQQRS